MISVTGTTLVLTGPPNVVFGDTATYTVSLRDSGGAGIPGRTVDVSSSGGNTLSANSLVTNSQGEADIPADRDRRRCRYAGRDRARR